LGSIPFAVPVLLLLTPMFGNWLMRGSWLEVKP